MKTKTTFGSFSVDSLAKAGEFYSGVLGLKVDDGSMGLRIYLPDGATVFAYPKDNHLPATFTVLNFVVDSIDEAVNDLMSRGVQFERYEDMPTDEKGIVRGLSQNKGPDIAWFKDPAGNILSIIQDS